MTNATKILDLVNELSNLKWSAGYHNGTGIYSTHPEGISRKLMLEREFEADALKVFKQIQAELCKVTQ